MASDSAAADDAVHDRGAQRRVLPPARSTSIAGRKPTEKMTSAAMPVTDHKAIDSAASACGPSGAVTSFQFGVRLPRVSTSEAAMQAST